MKMACKTDTGMKRRNNEDTILTDEALGVFILADGMGGHQAGEVASRLATETVINCLRQRIPYVPEDTYPALIEEVVREAHSALINKAEASDDFAGMGTTLIVLIIKDHKAHICHVGDSRAYLFGESMRQITLDHTEAQDLLDRAKMGREAIPVRSWHTLTNAVGMAGRLVPAYYKLELYPDNIILVCSDGLTDMLTDKEIEEIICEKKNDLNMAVDSLILKANERGGRDNISVILLECD